MTTKVKAIVKAGTAVAKSDWQKTATCYKITLKYQDRQMTVDFWCGSLHGKPDAFDVLYCLASDASGVQWVSGFESWADQYGYDADSREAEKTYKNVLTQTKKFKKLMGADFDALLGCDEDELKEWINS